MAFIARRRRIFLFCLYNYTDFPLNPQFRHRPPQNSFTRQIPPHRTVKVELRRRRCTFRKYETAKHINHSHHIEIAPQNKNVYDASSTKTTTLKYRYALSGTSSAHALSLIHI